MSKGCSSQPSILSTNGNEVVSALHQMHDEHVVEGHNALVGLCLSIERAHVQFVNAHLEVKRDLQ